MLAILALPKQLDADPHPVAEALLQPARLIGGRTLREPENEAALEPIFLEVTARQGVSALGSGAPPAGDQPAEPPIPASIGGQHHDLQAAVEAQLRSDDELQLLPL